MYAPKPAKVRAACEEASKALEQAHKAAVEFREKLLKADAILLEFDYAEWSRPWLLPAYHPALVRMLEEHTWNNDMAQVPGTFQTVVFAQEFKLRLLEEPERPKQLAAARKRADTKRSRKPRAEKEGEVTT